jgi:hypothetical protein
LEIPDLLERLGQQCFAIIDSTAKSENLEASISFLLTLISNPDLKFPENAEMFEFCRKILPYLEHSSVEIRSAAVESLRHFFSEKNFWKNEKNLEKNREILILLLRVLIQSVLLEPKLELKTEIHRCWSNLVSGIEKIDANLM